MDSLKEHYSAIIQKVFQDYIDFLGEEEGIQLEIVWDQRHVNMRERGSPAILIRGGNATRAALAAVTWAISH